MMEPSRNMVIDSYDGLVNWSFGGNYPEPLDCVLMQFTGLLDKNGKEIYEGDIVVQAKDYQDTLGQEGNHLVQFFRGTFVLTNKAGGWARGGMFEHLADVNGEYARCEVIGNIYENPELLQSSPHIPTGEDWEKEFEERFGTGIYFRYATQETEDKLCYQERKDVVKQFISDILLSKEKQWKDEMEEKYSNYTRGGAGCCAECEIYLDYKDSYQCSDSDCKCHSLLSNNQEDK